MARIEADFTNISSSFEPVPDDTYRAKIVEIKDDKPSSGGLPQVMFELDIVEGPMEGRKLFDFCILKQNDGQPNKVGLGRIKAYAEAILGDEAAAGAAIDTDELKGGVVDVVTKQRTYKKKDGSGEGLSVDIAKVLRVQ